MSEVNIDDEVLWRAIEVHGNHDKAMTWLNTPSPALVGATPISVIETENGVTTLLKLLDSP